MDARSQPGFQARLSRLLKRVAGWLLALLLLVVVIGGGWWWWDYRLHNPPIRDVPRNGGLDVTLWAVTDTHFAALPSATGAAPRSMLRQMDAQMRTLPGQPWPAAIGGKVDPAAALILSGDLTEDGKRAEWAAFADFYGLHPTNPALDRTLPMLECPGNHDQHDREDHGGTYVTDRVAARHGRPYYGMDFGDLRVISLGAGPDHETLRWLHQDLAAAGCERPVVLFMHYPLLGPWSSTWFGWNHTVTEEFHRIVSRFNIVAILHGHYHVAGRYTWRGIDVYNVGSVKHGCNSFGVIRVTDDRLSFGCWNADLRGWWWWHSKPINRPRGQASPAVAGMAAGTGRSMRSHIPSPIDRWCTEDAAARRKRAEENRQSMPWRQIMADWLKKKTS